MAQRGALLIEGVALWLALDCRTSIKIFDAEDELFREIGHPAKW